MVGNPRDIDNFLKNVKHVNGDLEAVANGEFNFDSLQFVSSLYVAGDNLSIHLPRLEAAQKLSFRNVESLSVDRLRFVNLLGLSQDLNTAKPSIPGFIFPNLVGIRSLWLNGVPVDSIPKMPLFGKSVDL